MLLGHDDAWRDWHAALEGTRMHHAWLLSGKAGLGKSRFALAAAHELVGGGPAPDAHPDIIVLTYGPRTKEDEKKRDDGKPFERARSIRIGQIRDVQRRLNTRPTLGERRAIIIDPADDLERPAANALLKSLEEPPEGTFFLLVCHSPSRLLPTIRSRCRTLRFPDISDAELAGFLRNEAGSAPENERAAAIAAANGSPGAALSFLDLGLGRLAETMRRIRDGGDPDFALRGDLTAQLGTKPDRDKLNATIALAMGLVGEGVDSLPAPLARSRIDAHSGLVRLLGEFLTFNYDVGLLALEIGNLLAGCASPSERANV